MRVPFVGFPADDVATAWRGLAAFAATPLWGSCRADFAQRVLAAAFFAVFTDFVDALLGIVFAPGLLCRYVPGDNREIQLQRASMPRVIDGDPAPPVAVRPRTSLLRSGLDRTPGLPYFLHEEEVPRAGVRVWQRDRRTRWRDGRVCVWLAAGKQTGRGEGSSGLA